MASYNPKTGEYDLPNWVDAEGPTVLPADYVPMTPEEKEAMGKQNMAYLLNMFAAAYAPPNDSDRLSARVAMKLFVKDWKDYLASTGNDIHLGTPVEHIAIMLQDERHRVPANMANEMAEETMKEMANYRACRGVTASHIQTITLPADPTADGTVLYTAAGVTTVCKGPFVVTNIEPAPGPRKPPISLQVEAHNPEAVDPDRAMSAVRAMCGGGHV